MSHRFGAAARSAALAAVLVISACSRIFPAGEIERIDFATLERAGSSNQYLVCPGDLCQAAVDRASPVFDADATRIRQVWDGIVAAAPRTKKAATFGDGEQVAYVQRSTVFKFPDIISMTFIDLPDRRGTLAIYSRSVYGESDFGVNRRRIEDWLGQLEDALRGASR